MLVGLWVDNISQKMTLKQDCAKLTNFKSAQDFERLLTISGHPTVNRRQTRGSNIILSAVETLIQGARFVPLILQLVGVLILLVSNALFYRNSRKYGGLKKAFVEYAATRFAMTDEELEKADPDEVLKTFPLAGVLYRNYRNSIIGVSITLIGVVTSFLH